MSYQESPAPLSAEAEDALFVAVVDVCEKSFFAFVESCESARFAELVKQVSIAGEHLDLIPAAKRPGESATPGWLKAAISFDGSFLVGTIDMLLPECLARWLVASLLGVSQEVESQQVLLLDDQVFDGIGEFTNMVCGAWLTNLSGSQAFALRPPEVTRMPPDWNPLVTAGGKNDHECRLGVNDLPVMIRVRLSTD